MHRIDTAGSVGGQFTEGNPQNGQRATKVGQAFMNDLQENVCQAIEAAGLTLVKGDGGQLAEALQVLVGQAIGIHGTQIGEGKWFHLKPAETEFYRFPNGQSLLAADYPALAAALAGDPFLAADAADKTNNPGKWRINGGNIIMPDLRGEFTRIWADDLAAGGVTRPGLGVHKANQNKTHTHPQNPMGENAATNGVLSGGSGGHMTPPPIGNSGGDEAVPDHTALYYLIRVK